MEASACNQLSEYYFEALLEDRKGARSGIFIMADSELILCNLYYSFLKGH